MGMDITLRGQTGDIKEGWTIDIRLDGQVILEGWTGDIRGTNRLH